MTDKSIRKGRTRCFTAISMVFGAGVGLVIGVVIGGAVGSVGKAIPFGMLGGAAVGLLIGSIVTASGSRGSSSDQVCQPGVQADAENGSA